MIRLRNKPFFLAEKNLPYLGIFLVAFFVRYASLSFLGPEVRISGDEYNYWRLSTLFLRGNYHDNFFLPLWPWCISIARYVYNDLIAARVLAILISSVSSALVGVIAARQFGQRTGVIAGLLHALMLDNIFYSHYIYAEGLTEIMILIYTHLLFSTVFASSSRRFAFACAFLGVGMLSKHLVIVALAAALTAIFVHRRWIFWRLLAASSLFLLAPILFSINCARKGQDPFVLANVVLVNAGRAHPGDHQGYFKPEDRSSVIKHYVEKIRTKGPIDWLRTFHRNFNSLWSLKSYPVARAASTREYYVFGNNRLAMYGFIATYVLLGAFGLLGLVAGPPGPFRTYMGAVLTFVSLLGVFLILVSRHRTPFVFVLSIYAGYFLSNFREAVRTLSRRRWRTAGAVAILVYILASQDVSYIDIR